MHPLSTVVATPERRWGKTREIAPTENRPPFRILPAATLAGAKGFDPKAVIAVESPERLTSVLAPYSPSAPLFDNHYPPERLTSGFIAHPKSLSSVPIVDTATAEYVPHPARALLHIALSVRTLSVWTMASPKTVHWKAPGRILGKVYQRNSNKYKKSQM